MAVHRLRRRYGLLLREEIAATVGDATQVEDEIQTLFDRALRVESRHGSLSSTAFLTIQQHATFVRSD